MLGGRSEERQRKIQKKMYNDERGGWGHSGMEEQNIETCGDKNSR